MFEAVLQRILRAVFGGDSDIDIPTEFDELKDALKAAVEAAIDSGTATGGSNITIVDTGKSWEAGMWVDATFEVVIAGAHYLGFATANTANTITFAPLAGGAIVVAGSEYSLKRPVTLADISDRAARLLGVIQSLQLPAALTTAGNLKQSIEERLISKTIRDIVPGAVGTFWLPETGNIDLSTFIASSWYIYAPTTATMVINCYLNISHDGGTTWRRAAGYEILDGAFVRDAWNSIDCPLKLAETKLEVVIGTAFPAELDLMAIRKA